MMNEQGAKTLASAIIIQTIDDINDLHKRVEFIRQKCEDRTLYKYLLTEKKTRNKRKKVEDMLPFSKEHDYTAVGFFDAGNDWAITIMDVMDINPTSMSKQLRQKLKDIKMYYNHCHRCVKNAERRANRNMRDEELEAILS